MEAEIIGTDGKVHYRRPHTHKDIGEALRTIGYSVKIKGGSFSLLDELPIDESHFYPVCLVGNTLMVKSWKTDV